MIEEKKRKKKTIIIRYVNVVDFEQKVKVINLNGRCYCFLSCISKFNQCRKKTTNLVETVYWINNV